MDPAYKQRLVGGIVLGALALIIIPTVLDFSTDRRSNVDELEIPEGPDVMKMEVMPLDVWKHQEDPAVERQSKIIEVPEPKVVDAKPKESAKPVADSKETAKTNPTPEPAKTTTAKNTSKPDSGASAWVVQVASLTVESKAFTLRDQLRTAGMPVFVERADTAKGTIYRVKAGPVLSHAEAEKIKKSVFKTTKLDGLVMRHR